MIIIGIDPGCTGSIVALNADGSFNDAMPMPVFKLGKKTRVNGTAIAAFLRNYGGMPVKAVIEQVGAMPGNGVSSMFTFGHSAGVVEGVMHGMEIPYQMVTPQAWKKSAGLIGSDKDAARTRCIQMYPGLRVLDLKGKGQALADSILIARYGAGLDNHG